LPWKAKNLKLQGAREMKEIILTGYSKKDYLEHKHNESLRCCYLCQKTEQDRAVFVEENGIVFVRIELKPFSVKIMDSDLWAKFLLCQNCYLLLHSFVEKSEFPRRLFERQGWDLKGEEAQDDF
jgi:hypothetical protein